MDDRETKKLEGEFIDRRNKGHVNVAVAIPDVQARGATQHTVCCHFALWLWPFPCLRIGSSDGERVTT